MEVCYISTTSQFKSSFRHLRCCVDKSYGDQAWENKNKNSNWASLKMNNKISRRRVMEVLGFSSIVLHAGVAYGVPSPMVEMKAPPQVSRIFKLPSGVKIEDVVEGEGPQAQEGDLVEVNYVCRRYNGYFVHSTVDQFSGESTPVILPLVDKKVY
ncbi:Peptidylprolyl isomerase [Thalictrum thalictroides]|uniref:peptidylprolyl isomerase n=1 Tax=Thalictrum thalictroides TaxID=46969 RepID=A0A7J6UZB9_THATH|nr:Peptidylprolyl isomerase [Thalictrum thalictroides]